MEVLYTRCCGLDVHKSTITACVRFQDGGGKSRKIVRRCGAMTEDLRAMASWLMQEGVMHVAMERTGVYWKPAKIRIDSRRDHHCRGGAALDTGPPQDSR